jgi:thiol-disulfide isomerase/thioredoxin
MDDKAEPEKKNAAKSAVASLDKESDSIEYKIQKNNLALLEKATMTPTKLEVLNSVANQIKWNHADSFTAPVTKIFNNLTPALKNSIYGEKIALALFPPQTVKEGDPMYDTDLTDIAGRPHHLADFKGKYILIDFWSFGCGPCHASVPELKEIEQKLKDKLTVVSLSSDTKSVWKKATDYFKMTGNNFSDGKEDRGIYAKYGVQGIPHYVLITPEGTIQSAWTGYGTGSIKSKIKQLTGFTIDD